MVNVHLKGKRVHLVTPDPCLARLIRETLAPHQMTVFEARTPQKAVVYAMSRPAHLLILDERMPSLEGKDLLVAIRMAAPKMALMIIGEHEHGSYAIDASARGADAVISRRSGKEQILNAVCHAMGVLPSERLPGVGPFHEKMKGEPTPGEKEAIA
jgi:DNA-binding NarL/FixJ family response regulator